MIYIYIHLFLPDSSGIDLQAPSLKNKGEYCCPWPRFFVFFLYCHNIIIMILFPRKRRCGLSVVTICFFGLPCLVLLLLSLFLLVCFLIAACISFNLFPPGLGTGVPDLTVSLGHT